MHRRIIKNKILCKLVYTNIGLNLSSYSSRSCYPLLIRLNERYVSPASTITSRYGSATRLLPQVNARYKSTITKEDGDKQENNTTKIGDPVKVDVKVSEGTKLTRKEQLKKAFKEYGSTVIVFHVTISVVSLGTCYLLVSSGLDVTKVFEAIGLTEWVSKSQAAASAGTFAVAYAIHKVFAPVRIAITLASVPLIVRYLRRIGFLKK